MVAGRTVSASTVAKCIPTRIQWMDTLVSGCKKASDLDVRCQNKLSKRYPKIFLILYKVTWVFLSSRIEALSFVSSRRLAPILPQVRHLRLPCSGTWPLDSGLPMHARCFLKVKGSNYLHCIRWWTWGNFQRAWVEVVIESLSIMTPT